MEDRQRAHELLKVDDVVALGVKGLEDLVHKKALLALQLEEPQRKFVPVDQPILPPPQQNETLLYLIFTHTFQS